MLKAYKKVSVNVASMLEPVSTAVIVSKGERPFVLLSSFICHGFGKEGARRHYWPHFNSFLLLDQLGLLKPGDGETSLPVVLLAGFDSSALEWRRLFPKLSSAEGINFNDPFDKTIRDAPWRNSLTAGGGCGDTLCQDGRR